MESLPSYSELKNNLPLSDSQRHFIEKSRQTVRDILNGIDRRLLLIIGPCSIHDPQSAKEFAYRLNLLKERISPSFFPIMRTYFEKPRTGLGWKGFLYDPKLDGSYAMRSGIEATRQMLLDLASLEIPCATEFLDPLTAFYYEDLIAWGSIGARTASSQIHRNLASALPMPIGFKNGVAGNISAAVNGALAATHPHPFIRLSDDGHPVITRTQGNPDTHIVLRVGESGPNYDPASVAEALNRLEDVKLPPRLLIDCAHHNSGKQHERQSLVFQSVIHQIIGGNYNIRGIMIESHLRGGKQNLTSPPSLLQYGVSITDPCLDWDSSTRLIDWGLEHLQQQLSKLQASL